MGVGCVALGGGPAGEAVGPAGEAVGVGRMALGGGPAGEAVGVGCVGQTTGSATVKQVGLQMG